MKRKLSLLAAMTLLTLAVSVGVTMASPPSGVTPTVLARGTYDAFTVKSSPSSPVDFKAKAKAPIDMDHLQKPADALGINPVRPFAQFARSRLKHHHAAQGDDGHHPLQ